MTIEEKVAAFRAGDFGTVELITAEIRRLNGQKNKIDVKISEFSEKRRKLEAIDELENQA